MTTRPNFRLKVIDCDTPDCPPCRACGQDVTYLVQYHCPVCRQRHVAKVCSSIGPEREGMCTEGIMDLGAGAGCGDSFRAALFADLHDLFDEIFFGQSGQTIDEVRAERISTTMGPVQGHA